MRPTVRRIQAIAAAAIAEKYLEIGVARGATFNAVNIQNKDAVDPHFRFDTKEFATEDIRFYSMTSDDFFVSGYARETYDIIFLDGLHTFEQTFRDFLASLQHAHTRTVWLIDDTKPIDVFSTLREPKRAVAARAAAGLSGTAWHGDTFKTIAAIHDFVPTVDYRTIVGSGNPQTLVWRSPRRSFQPVFDNLEAISRLEFFDIERTAEIFRYTSEEQAFSDWQDQRHLNFPSEEPNRVIQK